MDRQLFENKSEHERIEMLDAQADGVEEMSYMIPLNQDELIVLKDDYTRQAIALSRLEDEKKEVLAEYKEKMDPIKEGMSEMLQTIKIGGKEEKGNCYKIIDYESGQVGYYNRKGLLVYQRPALEGERRQLTITSSIRKAL